MEKYIPNMYKESIYTIPYELLKEKKITHLLFDLDNTLVPGHVKEATPTIRELFDKLKKMGFTIIIFSNSPSMRLAPFKKYLEVDVNAFSMKPLQRSFKKICLKYDIKKENIAIIGDQILTDIIGGNKFGITTILITPITVKDMVLTKWNRRKENKIFEKLEKENKFIRGKYYE